MASAAAVGATTDRRPSTAPPSGAPRARAGAGPDGGDPAVRARPSGRPSRRLRVGHPGRRTERPATTV